MHNARTGVNRKRYQQKESYQSKRSMKKLFMSQNSIDSSKKWSYKRKLKNGGQRIFRRQKHQYICQRGCCCWIEIKGTSAAASLDSNTKVKINWYTANRVIENMKVTDWRPLATRWMHLRHIPFSNIVPRIVINILIGIDYAELHCVLDTDTFYAGLM